MKKLLARLAAGLRPTLAKVAFAVLVAVLSALVVRGVTGDNESKQRTAAPATRESRSDRDADGTPDASDKCPTEPGHAPTGCPDADRDGVVDTTDACPDARGELPDGCPDTDNDGILDTADACPDAAGEGPAGCPDADGDGVADSTDRCPDTSGALASGCPKPPAAEFRTVNLATLLNRDTHVKGIGTTLFRYAWKGQTDVNFGTRVGSTMLQRNKTTCRSITLRGGSIDYYGNGHVRPELVVQREGRPQYTHVFTAGEVAYLPTLALSPGRGVIIKVRTTRPEESLAHTYLNGTAQCSTNRG